MNNQQLKYAQTRAKEMYDFKLKQLQRKFTTEQVRLSADEIRKAIKAGEYKINLHSTNMYYLRDALIFPAETNAVFDAKGYEAAEDIVRKAYNALTDELILGDNERAFDLLRAFEVL